MRDDVGKLSDLYTSQAPAVFNPVSSTIDYSQYPDDPRQWSIDANLQQESLYHPGGHHWIS